MTDRPRPPRPRLGALLLAVVLAGCGMDPDTRAELGAHVAASRIPAELDAGNIRVQASLAPSLALGEPILRRYGITAGRDRHLLLVSLRRIDAGDAADASVPARVRARVRDLRGVASDVVLREVRSEGFIDYAGEVRATPPDTLAIEVLVDGIQPTPVTLRFNRDVHP